MYTHDGFEGNKLAHSSKNEVFSHWVLITPEIQIFISRGYLLRLPYYAPPFFLFFYGQIC